MPIVQEIKGTCVGSEIAVDVEHHDFRHACSGLFLFFSLIVQPAQARSFRGFVCLIQAPESESQLDFSTPCLMPCRYPLGKRTF